MAHRRGDTAPPLVSGQLGQTDLGRWFVVERPRLDAAYRFDQIGFGPLDFNRTAWVRSGAIVSGNRGSWIRWWGSDLDFIKHRPFGSNPTAETRPYPFAVDNLLKRPSPLWKSTRRPGALCSESQGFL